jgi:hypothetical protein
MTDLEEKTYLSLTRHHEGMGTSVEARGEPWVLGGMEKWRDISI